MDRSRRITRRTAGLLAGVVMVGSAAGEVWPSRSVAEPSTPSSVSYRLGFSSNDHPTLRAREPGGPARAVLPADPPSAAYDAHAGKDGLVFASRRTAGAAGDRNGDIYLLRADETKPVRLTNDDAAYREPALSPNGQLVAFTSNRDGSDDIWVVNTDGTGLRQLTSHPGRDSWATWSPDSTRIAFSSTRDDPQGDIYVVSAAGGTPTRLTNDPAADTEPAWSPDGTRIAFTTTRFASAGDVVTMPAAGGPVSRAVPAPWDSSQPAWAEDSRRMAVVSRRSDPAGDVVVVNGTTVTPVASSAAVAERHPAWRGAEVIYTDQAELPDYDVWSADSAGEDRQDLAYGTAPAFSADGLHLAYSASQPGGGARIVVADADGANPMTLSPPGTLPDDLDTDPTWSPDGTMLAFTRIRGGEASASRSTLVVRVADGQQVGELPLPYYLKGTDSDPAWSPDGTQIAVRRAADPKPSVLSEPFTDRPATPGGQFTVEQKIPTPYFGPKPDIVFLIDSTLSMELVREDWRGNLRNLVDQIHSEHPQARFAVTTFGGQFDSDIYRRRLPLTENVATVKAAINDVDVDELNLFENWAYGLTRIAADKPSDGPGFRQDPDRSKIVVLVSDTYNKLMLNPDDGYSTIHVSDLTNALTSAGIYFVAASLKSILIFDIPFEPPMNEDPDHVADRLAAATGGRVVSGANLSQMRDAVRAGIRVPTLAVTPVAEQCDADLSVNFKPGPARVTAGATATITETIRVSESVPPKAELRCTAFFNTERGPGPPEEYRQEITVRVVDPGRPFVRVDDVTVNATDSGGAKVNYTATAVDQHGQALTPTCTPRSGSTFPIGQTVVTCTATGSGGTGSDIAKINVLFSGYARAHIWLASLTADGNGLIHFGDQTDLSARVTNGCAGGNWEDWAPAWAPGGKRLAFVTSLAEAPPMLCVVGVDGTGATELLTGDLPSYDYIDDPVWSPDGAEIAFAMRAFVPSESFGWQIHSVPSTGGTATLRFAGPGQYQEPTYQLLPRSDLRLSLSLSQRPGYVGGDDLTVKYTAVNESSVPTRNAWLSISLPAELNPTVDDPRCSGIDESLVCQFGRLGVGDTYVVTVVLHPLRAVDTVASGRLTATVGQQQPISRQDSTPLVVLQPMLIADPPIGTPGFVTEVRGVDFPPGATVRLNWQPGITTTPDTELVNPDGTFSRQQLVLRKDELGPRLLQASWVSGGVRFGVVSTDFLVVPRSLDPPVFAGRG